MHSMCLCRVCGVSGRPARLQVQLRLWLAGLQVQLLLWLAGLRVQLLLWLAGLQVQLLLWLAGLQVQLLLWLAGVVVSVASRVVQGRRTCSRDVDGGTLLLSITVCSRRTCRWHAGCLQQIG